MLVSGCGGYWWVPCASHKIFLSFEIEIANHPFLSWIKPQLWRRTLNNQAESILTTWDDAHNRHVIGVLNKSVCFVWGYTARLAETGCQRAAFNVVWRQSCTDLVIPKQDGTICIYMSSNKIFILVIRIKHLSWSIMHFVLRTWWMEVLLMG